jgi:S-layer protein (TIGR01567 family)
MNKKIIVPFVALMVLAMVGAASAADAVVDKLEIRGDVEELADGATTSPLYMWNATNFAAFWYDLDEDLRTESLWIEAGSLSDAQRTIEEHNLTYSTHPEPQAYELYENGGMQLESGVDNQTHYFVEGWLAERYVALNGKADELCKLLVEFEDDDKKTLSTGEAWDLGGGFALTAQQIDLEGAKCWLTLEKDGRELDSEVISTGAADKNESVYTSTQDIGGEDDVPMFSCHVDAVFRGTDTNIVQLQYVFLMDNDVLEIDSGDEFGIMEATASTKFINLSNKEDTVDLSTDNREHIMGNIYFQTADNGGPGEDDLLRFYPYVEYTIGEGAAGEAEDDDEVETPIETNETADVNVTPTAVVTPTTEPSPTAPEDDAAADADTAADAEETATEKKTPGFEAVFAIAGLLAVAYLVLRQRE